VQSTIKKFLYILPDGDKFKITILFLLILVKSGLEVLGIGMIPAFVSIVAAPDKILEMALIQPVLEWLNISSARDLLMWGSGVLLGVFVVKSAYIIFFNYIEARFIYNRRYTISHRMMNAYMQAPYTFHLTRNSSELLRNITTEVEILIGRVLTKILNLAREGLMALTILIFLLVVEPIITLVVISIAGVGAGTFLMLTKKKVKAYGKQEQRHRSEMIKAVNQGIGGLKDARVLNREYEFIKKFSDEARKSTRLQTYITYTNKIPAPLIETTAVAGMMLISGILVWQGRSLEAIIPILTLFAMAIVRLMPALRNLTSDYTQLLYSMVSIHPIYDDLRSLEKSSRELREERKTSEPMKLEDQINGVNIEYSYPGSDEKALKDVSFSIPRGAAVAFVGESGAGKTTIVDLLLGLLKPTAGQVSVDGVDIRKNVSAWQRNIGYIPQSIYLADETLRKNVAFGIPDEAIDDAKVMQAIELAQLKKMVNHQLPDGLDTMIGEHGTRLSGGQRQRVGIARALYHDPQVLVMDEATSALDNITEKEITRAIESLKGERTVIMIAHRLTTVENSDRLYLMKDGRIKDAGTYDELVDKSSEFRKMALVN
jgi:ATP-binding cassette subfamily C protein